MKKALLECILPHVRELRAYHLDRHGVQVKLDQNENTWGPPKPILDAITERISNVPLFRYPDPNKKRIRRAIGEVNDWPADGVLIGNGSDELLHTFARAVLAPGRRSVSPTPSFFVYGYAARAQGADLVEVPLDETLRYDVDALRAAVDEHTPDVLFLCSPNNPTGCELSEDDVAELAERTPGLLALDEAYWEFCGHNARPLLDRYSNVVLFRTFSKALALAGLRMGYVLARPELVHEFVKVQQPYPVNGITQEAAMVALEHYDLVRRQAQEIVAAREALRKAMAAVEGVSVFPCQTNFLLFRTTAGAKATFDGLLERGVLVRDMSHHRLLPEMLRVGVGTPEENDTFLNALKRTVEAT